MHKVIINGETEYAKDGTLLSDLLIESGKGLSTIAAAEEHAENVLLPSTAKKNFRANT